MTNGFVIFGQWIDTIFKTLVMMFWLSSIGPVYGQYRNNLHIETAYLWECVCVNYYYTYHILRPEHIHVLFSYLFTYTFNSSYTYIIMIIWLLY